MWVDRQGASPRCTGEPDSINEADAVARWHSASCATATTSQWVQDLAAGTRTRIVSDLLTYIGGWLPGNDRIVLSSNVEGDWDLVYGQRQRRRR